LSGSNQNISMKKMEDHFIEISSKNEQDILAEGRK
jgi:hypothetical protein